MANQVTIPLYDELINEFNEVVAANEKAESLAVQHTRRKAFENFKRLGFPTRRVEDWKYTSVTPFLQDLYPKNGKEAATVSDDIIQQATIPGLDCYQVVLVNGQLQSDENAYPSFIKVRTIKEAQQDEQFAAHFAQAVNVEQYHFAAMNSAFFSNGLFIEIAANTALDKPLHIVHLFAAHHNTLVQPRHLIVVRRGASLPVIETFISKNQQAAILVNNLTEVYVEENAFCDHYVLQTADTKTRVIDQTDVSQKRHSVYSNYTFCLPKSELIRNNLHISLDDDQVESHLYGLYMGTGNQLIDNHTLVNHKKPNCNSNEIYKGVLTENAVGVFSGKIYVQHDAQKTNAFQQNNNLLLSNKATINSKPQLEIFADDVKCSHGSTVGQLSKEAMFYLQSRGIGEQTAKAMLVKAFAFDVTEKIKIPELEKHINKLITQHIPLHDASANA